METQFPGRKSARLHLKDQNSGLTFLIDTGADVSVVPRPKDWEIKPSSFTLFAANMTPIHTYTVEVLTVQFLPGKAFNWPFYVADVPYPILGGNALAHFNFLPDLANKTLDRKSVV